MGLSDGGAKSVVHGIHDDGMEVAGAQGKGRWVDKKGRMMECGGTE